MTYLKQTSNSNRLHYKHNLHIFSENNLKLSLFAYYCQENQYIRNSIVILSLFTINGVLSTQKFNNLSNSKVFAKIISN